MLNKQRYFALAFILLLLTFGVSYYLFTEFKPKSIRQVEEVRGIKSDKSNTLNLPYPDKAQNLSLTKTDDSEQISFTTSKTKTDVKQYYKNVLATMGWKMEAEAEYDDYTIAKFSKETQKITVMAFEEIENETLVGIEIAND